MSDIEDEVCQTLTDLISENFCECSHLISQHTKGEITGITKCFGMDNNGVGLSACPCTAIRVTKFQIEVDVNATNL